MSENIPIEIQAEIMKMLPVKSLLQFRSVCKAWKSLIDSAGFINHYSGQHQLVVGRYRHKPKIEYITIADDETFPQQKVSVTLPLLVQMLTYCNIIGGSRGLFCLYDHDQNGRNGPESRAVLWNPSVRKAVAVVVPNVANNKVYETFIGFGVCRETTDPKIVKITHICTWKDIDRISCIPWHVEVFTISTGAWRSPYSSKLPRKSIYFEHYKVVIHGVLYWLATNRITYTGGRGCIYYILIVSIDMTSEEFREINLPRSLVNCFGDLSLSKLRDSLVVIEGNVQVSNPVFSVWMMGDGASKSFTKLFSVCGDTPAETVRRFRGFRRTGEPILEIGYDKYFTQLVSKRGLKHIDELGIMGIAGTFYVYPYVETLILLDQPDFITYGKAKRYIENFKGRANYRRGLKDTRKMKKILGFMDWSVHFLRITIWKHYLCLISQILRSIMKRIPLDFMIICFRN